jgi:LuxR family maltose regulon positive regulatory protein
MASQGTAVWLASTKLTAPARRHDALLRPRLIDILAKSLVDARLCLISAPAGAGKTTLLAELPHAVPGTTWAWLLLDGEDNDPSRFAAALVASLATAGIGIEEHLARPSEARAVRTAIINQIGKNKQRPVAIVIDDLHVISEQSVHELLDYLVDNLPPSLRLVLASRHDPPMALARRRARGELGEIRLKDLSFTEDETAIWLTTTWGSISAPGKCISCTRAPKVGPPASGCWRRRSHSCPRIGTYCSRAECRAAAAFSIS